MLSFLEPGFFLQAGTLRPYGQLALVFIGNLDFLEGDLDFLEGDLDFLVGESSYEGKNATLIYTEYMYISDGDISKLCHPF
jgi:hypothetical protein